MPFHLKKMLFLHFYFVCLGVLHMGTSVLHVLSVPKETSGVLALLGLELQTQVL